MKMRIKHLTVISVFMLTCGLLFGQLQPSEARIGRARSVVNMFASSPLGTSNPKPIQIYYMDRATKFGM